ncbi:YcaO-like family protein [uncultured Pleomorphomonas sp.]|uniref:YcaO-like family protein n=1 Tax=uncultured Pleomorphomonas sp. TaxID=442121 RepID=UPI00258BA49F|nr:YcaO-like family protein [uncultured Pleomorphomonas sp.]
MASSEHTYSDRTCRPEETLARVAPALAEHGVTRLAKVTGLDCIGIPVWNVMRPNARSLSVHQGKGITDIDAKASAVMEALERACAERSSLFVRTASAEELVGEGRLCDTLDDLVAIGHQPLDSGCRLEWVEGQDLIGGRSIWVPLEAVRLDFTRSSHFWQSSDGLASGNTDREAIFHGLLERIERDADTLWSLERFERQAATCVSSADLGDPVVTALVDRIERAGFMLRLFDMTSDLGVPTFSVLLAPAEALSRRSLRYIDMTMGSGTHPIAYRAALRAITEAVQSRLTLITGTRDDVEDDVYESEASEFLLRKLRLKPQGRIPADLSLPGNRVEAMLARLLEVLRDHGIGRVIAVRMNPGEERFSVMKMIVSGLEHPEGRRQRRFGARALSRLLVFR